MPHIVRYLSGCHCVHNDVFDNIQHTLPAVGKKQKFGTVDYKVKKVTTDRLGVRPFTLITFVGLLSIYPLSARAAPFLLADVPPITTACNVYVDAKAAKLVPLRVTSTETSCAFDLVGSVSGTRKIVFQPIVNGVPQPKTDPRNLLSTLKNGVRYFAVAEVACTTTGCVRDDVVQTATVVSN
jgi:hypothetical protein